MSEAELVFVPATCIDSIPASIRRKEASLKAIHPDHGFGYTLKGFVLRGRRRDLCPKLEKLEFSAVAHGLLNGRLCGIYATPGSVTSPALGDLPKTIRQGPGQLAVDLLAPVEYLAGITGLDIALHLPHDTSHPLFPEKRNGIDIVIGASPPGDIAIEQIGAMCGVRLTELGKAYSLPTYAKGYGRVVKDRFDVTVGQVVGTTLYLFLQTNTKELVDQLTEKGGALVRKCLELVWREYVEHEVDEPAQKPFTTVDECAVPLDLWDMSLDDDFNKWLNDERKKVEAALDAYNQALRDFRFAKRNLVGMQAHRKAETDAEVNERKALWQQLLDDPRVASISLVDEGYQLITTPILDAGTGRLLNRYGMRMNEDRRICVWSIDSPHPDRVPHPHISSCGVKCFGNVGPLIEDVLIARNIPSGFLLALDWLEDGYDPDLADSKIEEWPFPAGEIS